MDAIFLQILNGLDKGSAYALIALGLTLIFGTLGVVNFAHGALFMIGAFCAVTLQRILTLSTEIIDETKTDFLGNPLKVKTPYVETWFGPEVGQSIIDWSVPLALIIAVPVMLFVGVAMERGLVKHFYKRPHADQILVTFGLAIVLQEIIKYYFGANPIQTPAPEALVGSFDFGVLLGFGPERGDLSDLAAGVLHLCHRHHLRGFCVPAIHNLRNGGTCRYGRPRNRRATGHRHRQALYSSCSASPRLWQDWQA